jgi:hypothetical protein
MTTVPGYSHAGHVVQPISPSIHVGRIRLPSECWKVAVAGTTVTLAA